MTAGNPDFDIVVIGAGVIGLSAAMAAANDGRSVLILERNAHFGQETSARNSEVIHAGIYYPPGSLKAKMCIEGRQRLYEFATASNVPFRRCGKLIVANCEAQEGELAAIVERARKCGLADLALLDREAISRREPALRAVAGIYSPLTGIIDSHAYMTALLGRAENSGAQLVTRCQVVAVRREGDLWRVSTGKSAEDSVLARAVINCAGLMASQVAATVEGLPPVSIPQTRYAKGSYFAYAGKVPFSHLIYPLPEPGGLGTHLTLDLAGRARFGPNVEWVDDLDYAVDLAARDRFAAAAEGFWPDLDRERLFPGYAGIRPKLSGPGDPVADFQISGPGDHGLAGIVNLFGIESPGLTASLPLGERAALLALQGL